jgi:HAD superfamily hydrolase (TIGR01548 family)
MKNPTAIIFDIDDTLVDTTPSYRGSIIATVSFFGGVCTYGDISKIKAAGDANNDWAVTHNILAEQNIDVSPDKVTKKFEEFYQGTETNPGLKFKESLLVETALLKELYAQYRLGIVTGRPRKDALWFLKNNNIEHLFGAVVTMDDAPLKPSGEPVLLAAKKLGVPVERAWMIGDTPDDIRSAVAAGAVPIGVIGPDDEPVAAQGALIDAGAVDVWQNINHIKKVLH